MAPPPALDHPGPLDGPPVHEAVVDGRTERVRGGCRADVGILTVHTEELTAVVDMLQNHSGFRTERQPSGWQTFHATVPANGRDLRVVAAQALDRGPRSAAVACGHLRDAFGVPLVLLVGTASGVHPDLDLGDVVIADVVIYYDADCEPTDGPRRCGRTRPTGRGVDEFFRRYRGLVAAPDGEVVRVFSGPIGSYDAAVPNAMMVDLLRHFGETALAVDVCRSFYEQLDHDATLRGWLTIRGICDGAEADKADDRHQFAADNAALVTDRLLPLLSLVEPA